MTWAVAEALQVSLGDPARYQSERHARPILARQGILTEPAGLRFRLPDSGTGCTWLEEALRETRDR